jgi:hypothetical protein
VESKYEETGKLWAIQDAAEIEMFEREVAAIDAQQIRYGDITTFFPYLKNIEA